MNYILLVSFCINLTLVSGSFFRNERSELNVWPSFVMSAIKMQKDLDQCMLKLIYTSERITYDVVAIAKSVNQFEFR